MSKSRVCASWLRRAIQSRRFPGLTGTTNLLVSPATQNSFIPLHESKHIGAFSGPVFHCGGQRAIHSPVAGENSNVSEKRSPKTLLKWTQDAREFPEDGTKEEFIEMIKRRGLRFEEPPFDTKEDCKNFLATFYGRRDWMTDSLGALAYGEIEKWKNWDPSQTELADLINQWLNDTLDSTDPLTVGSTSLTILSLSEFQGKMKYVGRGETMETLKGSFEHKLGLTAHPLRGNKIANPLPILGAAPGTGKTRIQQETSRLVGSVLQKDYKDKYAWYTSVFVSYYEGNRPTGSEVGHDPDLRSLRFATRVLYQALHPSIKRKFATLEEFVRAIDRKQWSRHIRLGAVLSFIKKNMNNSGTTAMAEKPGIVHIGVDELNELVNKDNSHEKDALKTVADSLVDEMKRLDGTLSVFPLVSGTTMLPFEELLNASQFKYTKIPIRLLSEPQLMEVAVDCAERMCWPNDWSTTKVRRMLDLYGRHPRSLETLLTMLNAQFKEGKSPANLKLESIISQVKAHYLQTRLYEYSENTLRLGLLGIPIEESGRVDERVGKMTFSDFESRGYMYLGDKNGKKYVELSPPMIAPKCEYVSNKHLANVIEGMVEMTTNPVTWSAFEKLVLMCDAMREMLFFQQATAHGRGPLISLETLYLGAIGRAEVLSREFKLCERVQVADVKEKKVFGERCCQRESGVMESMFTSRIRINQVHLIKALEIVFG